jgi:hypothetical protein
VLLQIFNILRKKSEINFKTGWIVQELVCILHRLMVCNFIDEKGCMI